jgi:hypothetical protein
MASNKAKGDKVERDVLAVLQSYELLAMKSPRTMKRIFTPRGPMFVSQANDFFGLFDIICKNLVCETVYIQVKSTSSGVSSAKKGIEEFCNKWCNERDICEIWLKVPRTGYVIFYTREPYLGTEGWKKRFIDLKGQYVEPFTYS